MNTKDMDRMLTKTTYRPTWIDLPDVGDEIEYIGRDGRLATVGVVVKVDHESRLVTARIVAGMAEIKL